MVAATVCHFLALFLAFLHSFLIGKKVVFLLVAARLRNTPRIHHTTVSLV